MKYTVANTAGAGNPKDVFLDGVKLDAVIEADDEAGYVVVLLKDKDGFLYPDADGNTASERRTGKVVVVPRAE